VSNQTLSIINKATKTKDKFNIITFDTHERYQTQLCKTGHNFYSFRYDDCKEWDNTYGDKPENHYTLPLNSVINGIDYDFILSQSKFGQFQVTQKINQFLQLPTISLEHTLPIPSWPNEQTQTFKQMCGDINVFISEYSMKEWNIAGSHEVIHHSVDSNLFCPPDDNFEKNDTVLSVVNDFANRDYCCNYSGWKRITEGLNVRLVGKSDGLSKPADSIEDLVKEYQTSQVFLNTSTISPVPTSLLEAMSCGCAIVTTKTCMIPEIIENGVNGFMSNDEEELKSYIDQLLKDENLRTKMGKAARETILKDFSEKRFIDNWNNVFNKAYGVIK
jgi:hypothetical protein